MKIVFLLAIIQIFGEDFLDTLMILQSGMFLTIQEIQQLYSGSSNYNYNWSPGGETTSSITVQPTATNTYTVDVNSGTTTCQSDVTISVNQRDLLA